MKSDYNQLAHFDNEFEGLGKGLLYFCLQSPVSV